MKKYYEKFADKLEIIGVACKDKKEKWRKAVTENQLPWINLLNEESGSFDNLLMIYPVNGFPTKIILDPEKKIIGIHFGEGPDFYDQLDELLK